METKLTAPQENFLQIYVKHFNIARAYKEAYINTKSEDAARNNGSRLMGKDRIKTRLAEILKERNERTNIDSTYIIDYLKGAAELDMESFATIGKQGVELKEFKKIPKHIKKYCTEVNMTETKTGKIIVNFKVFSKEKAIEMLAKHTGATRERIEVSGTLNINSITDLINGHSD